LIINFLQLCSLAIWPFSKNLYRKINGFFIMAIVSGLKNFTFLIKKTIIFD